MALSSYSGLCWGMGISKLAEGAVLGRAGWTGSCGLEGEQDIEIHPQVLGALSSAVCCWEYPGGALPLPRTMRRWLALI